MTHQVQTLTQGCRLNLRESEVIETLARRAGLGPAVIVNTCAVTSEAARQSRQRVRKAVRENKKAKIIVTGCAAQIDPDSFKAITGVDRVLGNIEKMRQDSYAPQAKSHISDIMVADTTAQILSGTGRARSRAIVEVQTGCDHRCTFCIIPYGRGNSRSVPKAEIIKQIKDLQAGGLNEVVLSGVDISSWQDPDNAQTRLGDLVADILDNVPDLPRLRLSSIDPAEIDETLLTLIGTEARLTPYLHLSVQHGDTMILKRMKRRHTREQLIALCRDLRRRRPDISFGADIIAGFPTETD